MSASTRGCPRASAQPRGSPGVQVRCPVATRPPAAAPSGRAWAATADDVGCSSAPALAMRANARGGSGREAALLRALPTVTEGAPLVRRGRAAAGSGTMRHAKSIAAEVTAVVATSAISDRTGPVWLRRFTVRSLPPLRPADDAVSDAFEIGPHPWTGHPPGEAFPCSTCVVGRLGRVRRACYRPGPRGARAKVPQARRSALPTPFALSRTSPARYGA